MDDHTRHTLNYLRSAIRKQLSDNLFKVKKKEDLELMKSSMIENVKDSFKNMGCKIEDVWWENGTTLHYTLWYNTNGLEVKEYLG